MYVCFTGLQQNICNHDILKDGNADYGLLVIWILFQWPVMLCNSSLCFLYSTSGQCSTKATMCHYYSFFRNKKKDKFAGRKQLHFMFEIIKKALRMFVIKNIKATT